MKMIIWDLDETLWEGTVFYDDVKLKPETKEVLKQLRKLGVIQCIVSKNNEEDAIKKLKEFGIENEFAQIIVNWKPKHENIFSLLEKLNIQPEETLFVDDDPVNRESVKQFIGCHVDYEKDLYKIMKYFDTDRLLLMNQQRKRISAESNWKGNFKEFLKTVDMKITISEALPEQIPRITNLANRTNELNANRNRYTENQIEEFLTDARHLILVAHMTDKFGDYGLIGEIIVDVTDSFWKIEDLCVSCRTMGRGVGHELLKQILNIAKEYSVKQIIGSVKKDKVNFRMPKLYKKLGFKESEKSNKDYYYYIRDLE